MNSPPWDDAFDAVEDKDEAALRKALARGADVNYRPEDGFTLLTGAACFGTARVVKLLLAAGADPNLPDGAGDLPLHVAFDTEDKTGSESIACTRWLLEANADVNLRTWGNFGRSCLHEVIDRCRRDCIHAVRLMRLLLSRGANTEARDNQGLTPLAKSLDYGSKRLVLTLLRAGAAIKVLEYGVLCRDGHVPAYRNKDFNYRKDLNDYLIEIVNDGGWAARARIHRDRCLGVVSRCNRRLPRDVALSVVSFWSLPH